MKETDEQILDRVNNLNGMASSLCRLLMSASIAMEDNEAADHLFHRLREHVAAVRNNDQMYEVQYYIERVEELVELSSMLKDVPTLGRLHAAILDNYEALLLNRLGLYKVLEGTRRADVHDGLRENYWRN